MIKTTKPSVAVSTFSVKRKKKINFVPDSSDKKCIKFFSEAITEHFSMSEELAKAIGTVVVQALTENAKDEENELDFDDDDLELDDEDLELGESDLPESKKDKGEVEEAEGPKNAPDLSADFAEMKRSISNHSESVQFSEAAKHYKQVKELFNSNRF